MTLPATQIFLDGRVTLYGGDCLAVLAALPENSMDSVVTDPPYHLTSLVKRFGADGAAAVKAGKTGAYARVSGGFMGQKWDGGDIAFRTETWRQVWRVLKPGGYLLAFASTRGFGRMSVAIEDAGFITHPLIAWVFGSGFPKAHNAARAIDKALGCEGDKDAVGAPVRRIRPGSDQNKDGKWEKLDDRTYQPGDYVPGSPEAGAWQGWHYGGQALKPAIEPIYMGQKPFSEKNGAANILRWGTGALNIDACRVATDETITNHGHSAASGKSKGAYGDFAGIAPFQSAGQTLGRWPANLVHDGSDDVASGISGRQGFRRPLFLQRQSGFQRPDRIETPDGQAGRSDALSRAARDAAGRHGARSFCRNGNDRRGSLARGHQCRAGRAPGGLSRRHCRAHAPLRCGAAGTQARDCQTPGGAERSTATSPIRTDDWPDRAQTMKGPVE